MDTMREKVKESFYFRTAVRVYNDKKIPDEDLNIILDAAWRSPSSVGLEGWRFVVLENEDVKAELKEFAWGGSISTRNS